MLKRFVVACLIVGFSALAQVAQAKDLADKRESWTGFYVGLSAGDGLSDFRVLDGPANTNCWWCVNNYGDNADSIFAGGQLGYNYQMNNLILGIEGEVAGSVLGGNASDPTHTGPQGSVDGKLYGAITGRIGYAVGSVLLYGKAGYGAMDTDINWVDPVYSAYAHQNETLSGAVFGGGIEYAISSVVSVKAEYMRLDFGGTTVLDVKGYPGGYQQGIDIEPIDTFKVGVDFRLNSLRH